MRSDPSRDPPLSGHARVDSVVASQAIPTFLPGAKGFGTYKGGWSVTYVAGKVGNDMMARDIVNYGGLRKLGFLGLARVPDGKTSHCAVGYNRSATWMHVESSIRYLACRGRLLASYTSVPFLALLLTGKPLG